VKASRDIDLTDSSFWECEGEQKGQLTHKKDRKLFTTWRIAQYLNRLIYTFGRLALRQSAPIMRVSTAQCAATGAARFPVRIRR
jgi:hypothetical protein